MHNIVFKCSEKGGFVAKVDFVSKVRILSLKSILHLKSARNNNENLHSILKEQLDFNNHLSRKGWTNVEIYVKQFRITMAMVALIRVENGIKEGFVKISEGVFS